MTNMVTRILPAAVAGLALTAGIDVAHAGLSPHWEESGMASWYGPRFNGRATSSGQAFDQNAMTAAHDQLPLGTKIRVTRQDTGDTVVVTITDRMPPKRVRVIDLSRGAAVKLRLIGKGVGPVTLTEARPGESEPLEVAQAPDDADDAALNPRRRGRPHTHLGGRRASGHR